MASFLNTGASMPHAELADASFLFIGSTHISMENTENSELAREWTRRQLSEAAARLSPPAGQIVDLPPRFGVNGSNDVALSLHA